MTLDDYMQIGGMFLGAFASGYVSGVSFRFVKQVLEKAVGR